MNKCRLLKKRNGGGGFTLVEIMVVVIIIGVLTAMAIPGVQKVIRTSRNNVIINDLRVFTAAFQQYAVEYGDWPGDQASGDSYPTGMDGYLGESSWTNITPIGGNYDWDKNVTHNGTTFEAVISINDGQSNEIIVSMDQLEEIDAKMDDGVLSTGYFRLGRRNAPIFIVAE